jgi:hypothetical protein
MAVFYASVQVTGENPLATSYVSLNGSVVDRLKYIPMMMAMVFSSFPTMQEASCEGQPRTPKGTAGCNKKLRAKVGLISYAVSSIITLKILTKIIFRR